MSSIKKYSKIRRELLSEEFYFLSFLQEAYGQAELSDSEMESIQLQCMKLLADSTQRYNRGESSSVRIEAAQGIMASNFYTIGLYLKSFPDISSALHVLKNEPVSELYQRGRRIINTKLHTAKHLYQLVCKTKIQSPNYTYNATIGEGVKIFFKQYNADYEAHEVPASIDYQLMDPVTGLAGVEYIIQYLHSLYLENLFCAKFDSSVIHEAMCGYDEGYKDLLVNIFGQVLQNALGCALLNKDIVSLDLVSSDLQRFKTSFKNKTKGSIYVILQPAADAVIKALALTNASLQSYIYTSLTVFASRVYLATKNDTLQTLFTPRYRRVVSRTVRYDMGRKMDDEAYRKIVNEVLACRYSADKVQIIKEHIKTLSDMEDIITDGELSETEAMAVFNMLDDVEVAVLLRRHSSYRETDAVDLSEAEIKWQQYLERYLQNMAEDRLERLQRIISEIECEYQG